MLDDPPSLLYGGHCRWPVVDFLAGSLLFRNGKDKPGLISRIQHRASNIDECLNTQISGAWVL